MTWGARAAVAGALLLGRGSAAAVPPKGEGAVGSYFDGPIEVVVESAKFSWLESPLWSDEGQFLLFAGVRLEDSAGDTTGMIWKYDVEHGLTEFLPRAGVVGPGSLPADLSDYKEAGPSAMVWSSSGYPTLLLGQYGMSRIVSFSLDDVANGSIADSDVTVVADEYDGVPLNGPAGVTLVGDLLLFSDPEFGRQFRDDTSMDQACARSPQPSTNVYFLRSPFDGSEAPQVLLSDVWRVNGLAYSAADKLFVAHTDRDDPSYSVFDTVNGDVTQVVAASEGSSTRRTGSTRA
jgi:sugar lactone lactonase YvrE